MQEILSLDRFSRARTSFGFRQFDAPCATDAGRGSTCERPAEQLVEIPGRGQQTTKRSQSDPRNVKCEVTPPPLVSNGSIVVVDKEALAK